MHAFITHKLEFPIWNLLFVLKEVIMEIKCQFAQNLSSLLSVNYMSGCSFTLFFLSFFFVVDCTEPFIHLVILVIQTWITRHVSH